MRSAILHSLEPLPLTSPILPNTRAVMDYLRLLLAEETSEQLRVLFLDSQHRLIRNEIISKGDIVSAPCNTRDIMRRALELAATALILVHNHPSGDPTPSDRDVLATAAISRAAIALGIELLDHLVVARSGTTSLRALGLLPNPSKRSVKP